MRVGVPGVRRSGALLRTIASRRRVTTGMASNASVKISENNMTTAVLFSFYDLTHWVSHVLLKDKRSKAVSYTPNNRVMFQSIE